MKQFTRRRDQMFRIAEMKIKFLIFSETGNAGIAGAVGSLGDSFRENSSIVACCGLLLLSLFVRAAECHACVCGCVCGCIYGYLKIPFTTDSTSICATPVQTQS